MKLRTMKELRELIEQAHMAGQAEAGIAPSYSNARAYYDSSKPALKSKIEGYDRSKYTDGFNERFDKYIDPAPITVYRVRKGEKTKLTIKQLEEDYIRARLGVPKK